MKFPSTRTNITPPINSTVLKNVAESPESRELVQGFVDLYINNDMPGFLAELKPMIEQELRKELRLQVETQLMDEIRETSTHKFQLIAAEEIMSQQKRPRIDDADLIRQVLEEENQQKLT